MAMSGPEDEAASAALLAALPALRRKARAIGALMARDIEPDDLTNEGALAFLVAWPKARTNPGSYAMACAEGAMRERVRVEGRQVFDHEPATDASLVLPRRIRRAVRSLRRPHRDLLLCDLRRMGTDEIAATLGLTREGVYTRRRAALRLIREKLRPETMRPPPERKARPVPGRRACRPSKYDWPTIERLMLDGASSQHMVVRYGMSMGTLTNHMMRYRQRVAPTK